MPSILANITVPLVGMVDTAVAGHLPAAGGMQAATFIGAVSAGVMLFNLLYWNFSFLRSGTGGLTAQAFGRGDMHDAAKILFRGLGLALLVALVTLALQIPYLKLAVLAIDGSSEVETLASQYFRIRIWAAPATLSLMAFSGWFVGMQDTRSSMWKDLIVNSVNIAASILLSLGAGSFKGLGFAGIALGTLIAQYAGLAYCLIRLMTRYRKVVGLIRMSDLAEVFERSALGSYFKLNTDLLLRSFGFTAIYMGYTMIAASLGDMILACSAIMMQLLMVFSYFTDGFAYAGEALAGRFIGADDRASLRQTVRLTFIWSMGVGALFIFFYGFGGGWMIGLLSSDSAVVTECSKYLPWLLAMPPIGVAAFTWDGIYLGATASVGPRDSMLGAAFCFFAVWFAGKSAASGPQAAFNLLMMAYFSHLLFRTAYLSIRYKKLILTRVS